MTDKQGKAGDPITELLWYRHHKNCPTCGANLRALPPEADLVPHWQGRCKAASPVPSQQCPKCGYAGIGPCSCEYKPAQPAQLSAGLEDIEELLWSPDAHCLICREPINCDCRHPAPCGIHKEDCPIPTVLDKIKALAEAYTSAVAQRERPYRCICHNFQGDHEEECSDFNKWSPPEEK